MKELLLGIVIAAVATVVIVIALEHHARALVFRRRLRIDRFKLRKKLAVVIEEVFSSEEVAREIGAYAERCGVSRESAWEKAHDYLDEIVPKFNLLAYYRVGAPIARLFLHFLYWVVVERKTIERYNETAGRGTVTVYMINHRSNADYVLVAHMLFKFISLSYAVGEWARVWPLNHLFKWFGAYFVRRGYREPLYHAVLANYVRTITRHGVTQGVFLEGGLSRDGRFRKPKLGMLDYLVTSKREPSFTGPLCLIPTAINYDRVLEDRILTEELLGREDRATRLEKLRQTSSFLFKNAIRSLARRFRRYGNAVVAFGEPIVVDEFIREHPAVLAETFEERKPELGALADLIMTRISRALPVTPVTIVATIFRKYDGAAIAESEILAAIDALRAEWRDRTWCLRENTADQIWKTACEVLSLRRLVECEAGSWRWHSGETILRDYYANALVTYEEIREEGWDEQK